MKVLSRIIVISIIGAIASLLLVVLAVKPVLNDVTDSNLIVKQKKTELATLDQQIRAFKNAQSDLAKATRKDEIANAIVPKENLVVAVKDLEVAAAKTNTAETIDLREPDVGQAKPADVISGKQGVAEVPYKLTIINDFVGTQSFISYLEHLPHFTEISKITLSAETREGDKSSVIHTGKLVGTFDAVFFVKSPQQ